MPHEAAAFFDLSFRILEGVSWRTELDTLGSVAQILGFILVLARERERR
jgi:hypothetical protein